MANRLKELAAFGQSPWLDSISRGLIDSGELDRLIREDGLKGITSNPSIFEGSISSGAEYDDRLLRNLSSADMGRDAERLYELLAIEDIRDAADKLLGVYEASAGFDGYVSLEVSPALAYDAPCTVHAAHRLYAEVGRPNVMIKVPATKAALPAIERLLSEGLPINVTLIFSVERYEAVMGAYLSGLEKFAASGRPLSKAASVASFFVSRIDTAVDKELKKLIAAGRKDLEPLLGKAAVAQAKAAYRKYQEVFSSPRFAALKAKGARAQRPLWASTGAKDPAYSDVLYIDELIGPDTVNTMPPATWKAFLDHGRPRASIQEDVEGALQTLQALKEAGIDMGRVTGELKEAGVKAFADAFRRMIEGLAVKARKLGARAPRRETADEKSVLAELSAEHAVERIWAKDPSLWKQEDAHKKIISNSLGWLGMPKEMASRTQELSEFAGEIRKAGLRRAVLLGMGGSSLAPEVFRRTFAAQPGFPALTVLDSTDPEAVLSTDKENDPKTTLFVVSSKSGTTTEPLRLFDYFWGRAESALRTSAGEHFIAITDPGSFLEGQAKERKFRRVFRNFPDIGGRFSALSYFGLVPAALLGIDVPELLRRASEMAQACAQSGPGNPGLRLGAQLAAEARAGRDKVTLLMSPEIESLGLWLEQLAAESTGKEGQGVVPVSGEPPAKAEDYSRDRVFVLTTLRSSRSSDPQKLAGELEAAGHPVIRLELSEELDLCAEFFRWEIATAVLGRRLGIDPFDQPDVQSAKDKTKAVLDARTKTGRLPSIQADVAEPGLKLSFSLAAKSAVSAGERPSLDDSIARFLASARPGDYLGLLAFVSPRGGYDGPMRSLARALRAASPAALQSGYGPRYLHSTGQLHKGGPNSGLFIVLAREDAADLPIPGCAYGFADLVNAQALGDFQALDSAARRAVLVRFAGDPRKAFQRLEAAVRAVDRRGVKAVKS